MLPGFWFAGVFVLGGCGLVWLLGKFALLGVVCGCLLLILCLCGVGII